jgi:asparagine synthase (glutamine-hydrolysing)
MCGLVGVVESDGRDGQQIVREMLRILEHRGPDEQGLIRSDKLSLGMARLSIIDQEEHSPPYRNRDDSVLVAYNGEIYNFPELVNRYCKGREFSTGSDVEVLIDLYEQEGISAIEKLNGMFSIALYDKRLNKLFLIRDRAGEKPLYYHCSRERLVFASEIKALFATVTPELNEKCLDYEALEFCSGEETLFQGIYSVAPGDYIEFDLSRWKLREVPYWRAWNNPNSIEGCDDEVADRLADLLIDAISLRCRNQSGEIGCFVSGGLDSSLVAAIAKPEFLYTIHFDAGPYYDELEYARIIADHIGRELIVVEASPEDFQRTREKIAYHLDLPCTWTSFSLWMLLERCHQDVKVVLSGDGADEVFGGYHRYLLPFHDQEIRKLPALQRYGFLLDKYYGESVERYARLVYRGSGDSKSREWLEERIERLFSTRDDIVNQMGITDFYLTMQVLLQMSDRLAMAFSVENRSPFLDHRLIEFGFNLRQEHKIREGKTKWILKKVAERFVPREIVERNDKRGFSAPLNQWFGWDSSGKFQRTTYRKQAYSDWYQAFFDSR